MGEVNEVKKECSKTPRPRFLNAGRGERDSTHVRASTPVFRKRTLVYRENATPMRQR
jgi:hypothetical protein